MWCDLKCQKLKSVIARVICHGIFVGGGCWCWGVVAILIFLESVMKGKILILRVIKEVL